MKTMGIALARDSIIATAKALHLASNPECVQQLSENSDLVAPQYQTSGYSTAHWGGRVSKINDIISVDRPKIEWARGRSNTPK